MTREARLKVLIGEASRIYHEQPKDKKNGLTAASQAIDKKGISWWPDREWYLPRICSALGKSGGNTTAARRRQLAFDFQ